MSDRVDEEAPRQPTLINPAAARTQRLQKSASDADGTVVAGRYELRDQLGAGGMCEVWRARDTTLQRDVALKRLLPRWEDDPAVRSRFTAEALRVAKLNHPAVVGVLDAGQDEGSPFLVMELVDGPTLADLLADGPLDSDAAVAIGIAVAQGLGAAHRQGIVHRDVKPDNILLDPAQGAKLADFGVAKAISDADQTATGMIVGTAAYLAPEQAMGQSIDIRTDVYALGCVVFECLTGERPFSGDTPVQTASARIGVQVRPSDRTDRVPAAVDEVVARAMAPAAADRWADGEALAQALTAAIEQAAEPSLADIVGASALADPAPSATVTEQMAGGRVATERFDADQVAAARTAIDPHAGEARPLRAGRPAGRTAAGRTPAGRTGRAGRQRENRLPVIPLLLVAIVLIGSLWALRMSESPSSGGSGDAAAEEGTGDAASPLTGLTLTAFDPQGDGNENDSDLPNLTDGDASTPWTTVGYNSAAFGNLKAGVGVIIDLGQDVEISEVRLLGMPTGQSVELRVADAAPSSLEDTRVIARGDGMDADAALRPAEDTTTRYLVVWLVPDLPPDGGRFRGAIGEVQVFGG